MFSKKFLKFIEIWQKDFGFERSLEENACLDGKGNPIPWYTYPAIEYLSQFDYGGKHIFEYGCANSSLFWAERAESVTGVEHSPEWFDKWQKSLRAPNLQILLRQNDSYEEAVTENKTPYDVIIIDGVRRRQCAENAVKALAAGGIVIFDDSDRIKNNQDYRDAVMILKNHGLLQIDFYGFCPTSIYPKATSIFFSRNFDFPLKAGLQPSCGIGSLWNNPRWRRKKLYRLQLEK